MPPSSMKNNYRDPRIFVEVLTITIPALHTGLFYNALSGLFITAAYNNDNYTIEYVTELMKSCTGACEINGLPDTPA